MKILKHGSYFGEFVVKCPICGCTYEAEGPEELIFDYYYTNLGGNVVPTVRVRCPECEAFDDFKLQDTKGDRNVIVL